MLLSVIIPTYNRRDALYGCLKHLTPELQKLPLDTYEVIVTDDAPVDPNDPLTRDFPWVRLNHGPQKGPACNRNSGARAATGDWIIFLDDDCLPQPQYLTSYIEAIRKNPECLVFEGSTLAERPRVRLDEEAPINDKGGYLWSCNFMVQKKLFWEMGGFCELYPYACMEDVDFREQLRARKIPFLFAPEASVIHPWRAMAPDRKFLKMRLVSHAIFYKRYPQMRPTLNKVFMTIMREWVWNVIMDAPRLKFRGFWRLISRQTTITLFVLLNWAGLGGKEPRS